MCKSCGTICHECGHSSVIHRKNGACYAGGSCLCGWSRNMSGELYVKSTGEYAGERSSLRATQGILGSSSKRAVNKGVRVSKGRRKHLLRIPCFYCGEKAESLDHFIPRAKGGSNESSNLVSACHICNGMKSDKSYDELLVFCREMETAECQTTSLRRRAKFFTFKDQAKKILAWHEKRVAAKAAKPKGPEYMLDKQLPVV